MHYAGFRAFKSTFYQHRRANRTNQKKIKKYIPKNIFKKLEKNEKKLTNTFFAGPRLT